MSNKMRLTQRVLYNEAKPVMFDYPAQLGKLKKQLASMMIMKNGLGLAAPQVGIGKQVFVMQRIVVINDKKQTSIDAMFNPDITRYGEETASFTEGCLSFPGKTLDIVRPIEIDAVWYDENGTKNEETLTGLNARVFQHEFDHLYGVTFYDRL